jgi:TolB protein
MNFFKIVFGLLLCYISLFSADIKLEIVKKFSSAPSVYFINFTNSFISKNIKKRVSKLIVGDAIISGHMKPVEYNKKNELFLGKIDYKKFKNLGADIAIFYKLETNGEKLSLKVKAYDINTNQISYIKTYNVTKASNYPFLIHQMIIDLNDNLGAPDISWMKKLVIFAKKTNMNKSNIMVADYTLTYQKNVVSGGINIFPKWVNERQDAFYYTYLRKNHKPTIYKQSLKTAKKTKIIDSDGIAIVSDVSSDENKLLLTMSPEGQTDIYLYNLVSKRLKRLTRYLGIDVGGHFINNDKSITFVSDRLGSPNIFSKSIYASKVELLVHHGTNNNSCTAFGDQIVFVSRDNARKKLFNLYMISTKDNRIKKLTSNGVNQFPKFSNDGESVLFIKHYKNQSSIGVIRLKYNQSYLFPLEKGKIQSIDW